MNRNDWYGDYVRDDAMFGPAYAEAIRFPHESIMRGYREVLHFAINPGARAAGMWTEAWLDCLIEGRAFIPLTESPHYQAPMTIARAWREAVKQSHPTE